MVGDWFKQPHLAQVRLIRVWGWVRLANLCPRVMLRSICTRKSEFPSSQSEIATGTPPEVGYPTRKVGRISQTRLRNPRWLLCASTVVISVVMYSFLALLSICGSLNQS